MRNKSLKIFFVALLAIILSMSGCNRQAIQTTTSIAETETPLYQKTSMVPDNRSVRTIGRTYKSDEIVWLPQSGSAVEFEVTGLRIKLEIVGDDSVNNDPDLCPRFAVCINGKVIMDKNLNKPEFTVDIVNRDEKKPAVVKLIHLSEAKRGSIGLKKIQVESCGKVSVAPTRSKDIKIEFIGDSITCGYGVEGKPGDTEFKTSTENFMKSFAYLSAEALNADYSAICYSGYGVISGSTGDGEKNNDKILPPLYDYVSQKSAEEWNQALADYDIIVINLGTNDYTYTKDNEERLEEFYIGYEKFLTKIYNVHPDSLIICTLGAMGGQEMFPYIQRAIESITKNNDGANITYFFTDKIDYATAGTNGHPNAKDQQELADKLVEFIKYNTYDNKQE